MEAMDVYEFILWFHGLLYFSWVASFSQFSGTFVYWREREWYTHDHRYSDTYLVDIHKNEKVHIVS